MLSTLTLALLAVAPAPAHPTTPPQDAGQDAPEKPQDGIPADTEIVETASGLKYSILRPGPAGAEYPRMGDKVRVHYTGWTTDGKKFDSSRDRDEPFEVALGLVVEGWNEGMQLCPVGGRIKLTIPAELGYGEQGVPRAGIAGGATLVFDVEVLDIVKRALPRVRWPEDEAAIETNESGLAWHVIEPGVGEPIKDQIAVVEYTVRNFGGGWVGGSTYDFPRSGFNGPLVLTPGPQVPYRFLNQAREVLREGSRVLFKVPAAQGFGRRSLDNLPPGTDSYWQLEVKSIFNATRPEFQLPADTELTTTESGLKYKILREGTGNNPTPASTVLAHYAGWLTNGTEFDSSWKRGAPTSFGLSQVVKGWTEGLQLVREGGRILLVIPPELGYGNRPAGQIPPGSTLVFVVDLIAGA